MQGAIRSPFWLKAPRLNTVDQPCFPESTADVSVLLPVCLELLMRCGRQLLAQSMGECAELSGLALIMRTVTS